MTSVSQRISDCSSLIGQDKFAVLSFHPSLPPKDNLNLFGIMFIICCRSRSQIYLLFPGSHGIFFWSLRHFTLQFLIIWGYLLIATDRMCWYKWKWINFLCEPAILSLPYGFSNFVCTWKYTSPDVQNSKLQHYLCLQTLIWPPDPRKSPSLAVSSVNFISQCLSHL